MIKIYQENPGDLDNVNVDAIVLDSYLQKKKKQVFYITRDVETVNMF